jgi:three-Cys-motif partner protein
VDAFAGRGKQQLPRSADLADHECLEASAMFLEGSAIRALNVSSGSTRGFDKFIFIESNRAASEELGTNIMSDFPKIVDRIEILRSDANKALCEYIDKINWATTRSLVFLDPFCLEVRWDTIARLASTQACDVWYLFPLVGVIRMMTNTGKIDQAWKDKLSNLFGTADWYDEFYPMEQTSIFGSGDKIKDASTDHILSYIQARLKSVFAAVSNPAVLYNSRGFPLFALVMGVSNPRARKQALGISNHLIKQLSLPTS